MTDEEIQNQIFEYLRIQYKPNEYQGISSEELSADLGIQPGDILTNLHYMDQKKWIVLDDSDYEFEVYLEPKGFEEFSRRKKKVKIEKNSELKSNLSHQKQNSKKILQVYLVELKKANESRNAHNVQRVGERLLEFCRKLDLTYVETHQLIDELVSMISMAHGQRGSKLLSTNQESINKLFDEYLVDYIIQVIYLVETLIELPKEINIRKKQLPIEKKKGGIFKLFSLNQKDSKNFLVVTMRNDAFYSRLMEEINKSYHNEMYLVSLMLIRKLFENLIIDILRKKFPEETDLYLSSNNKYHKFYIIIKNTKKKIESGEFDSVKNEFEESLNWITKLREEGNKTAHSITFDIKKKELDGIRENIIRNIELLDRVFSLL